jgi:hypothetical protein
VDRRRAPPPIMKPRAITVVALLVAITLGCGSSQRMGRRATSGALEELRDAKRQLEAEGAEMPFERAAGNAVKGALSELDDPERQAELSRLVGVATESALDSLVGSLRDRGAWGGGPRTADGPPIGALGDEFSAGFALGLSRQLRLEIGANGDGPLGNSLVGLMQQMSGAAANGVVNELSALDAECAGSLRRPCVDQRVYEVSRRAAVGFADGLVEGFRIPLLVAAFAGGLLVAFVIVAATRRRTRVS